MHTHNNAMLGRSPEFLAAYNAARVVANTDVTLLLLGESGTGKELMAHAVHRHSRRAAQPFITVNCTALPDSLAESELFGHRRGAFTGAIGEHLGRIRAAAGGTLFLDEVGELSVPIQAKLLRFLESGECHPVGQTAAERVDVRVIAATNRDLHAEVQAGRFRKDLYYRLHVVPLELPPLRNRTGDLDLLLRGLTENLATRHALQPPRYTRQALAALATHPWPGNVRELRNFCERMLILFAGKEIGVDNLPHEIRHGGSTQTPNRGAFALPDSGIRLDDVEAQFIRQALDRTHGNRSRAARLLGLTRDTLLYRIKKYAIQA